MKKDRVRTTKVKNSQKSGLSSKAVSKTSSKSSKIAKKNQSAPKKNKISVSDKLADPPLPKQAVLTDLPFSYNETKLVLLVRDPIWAYGYWDFSSKTWKWIQDFFVADPGTRPKLRVHNLDLGTYFDLNVHLEAKNWYIELAQPDTSFEAELGLMDSNGRFHRIVKSNRVRTPRDKPSTKIDPNWDPTNFEEIYKLSGGGKTGHGSEIFSQVKKTLAPLF